jgi:hypothetical protein
VDETCGAASNEAVDYFAFRFCGRRKKKRKIKINNNSQNIKIEGSPIRMHHSPLPSCGLA